RHTRSKRDWSSDVCSSDLPFIGDGDLFELQIKNPLVDGKHSIEHFLEREEIPQRLGIDGEFLFLELVLVIAPIPNVDPRRGENQIGRASCRERVWRKGAVV